MKEMRSKRGRVQALALTLILMMTLIIPATASVADVAEELYQQALAYFDGTNDIQQDYEKAFHLFLASGEMGSVKAQEYLGYMYRNGIGTQADAAFALQWYQVAAEQGSAYAKARGDQYAWDKACRGLEKLSVV